MNNCNQAENRKVCLAYSAGGHYAELIKALDGVEFSNVYHVTFDSGHFNKEHGCNRFFLTHPRKKVGRTLLNAIEALRLLYKQRPKIIISTGADVTVPTIILGKLLFGCKVIFIESAGDITPTLTGKIVYRFCDLFIVQWLEHKKHYPNAVLCEGLLL
ncbi:MAG: polysaccharide biosynthesis protein [Cycloclasticus sp.]|nr:MAG: polysaccharide biosynthesis protein [Cycloclasticus sp.]